MTEKRSALVVGAGDATGGAIARRFAREGYVACVTRRTAEKLAPLVERIHAEGGIAHPFGSDARIEEEVIVTETGPQVITRFPADELLVAGRTYVRGADFVDGRLVSDGNGDGGDVGRAVAQSAHVPSPNQ